MTNPAIETLERASQIFLAPPNLVTPEQRHEAEAIIMDFRKIKSPYQLCKEILETSTAGLVLFEAVCLLKNSLIKEWTELNDADILALRRYLLQYVVQRQLPSFVREHILQLMAIMVKRLSLEDAGNERRCLVEEARSLVGEGPQSLRAPLGCAILHALLQEHAITVRSTDIGLPWAQHFKLKKQFEESDLRTIFAFVMKVLEELEASDALREPQQLVLAEKLLLVAESALCWGHVSPMLPKRLVGVFEAVHESDSPPDLRRSAAWRPLLTAERLPGLLGALATRQPLLRPAMSCLGQLASLSGPALASGNTVACGAHALRVARALFPLLEGCGGAVPPAAPASALRRLALHSAADLLKLPHQDLQHLLHGIVQYVVRLVQLAAIEEAGAGSDEGGCREGLEAALEAWVGLLHASAPPCDPAPPPLLPTLVEGSAHIFDSLLRFRLGPPDGNRYAGAEEEAEVEEEGSDLERCDSLLQLVGALGRAAPAHTLPLLCRLLEARTERMCQLLQGRHDDHELCNIYEDLHWTLLFAGHVLTMEGDGEGDGETPLAPSELIKYSVEVPGDVQASLRLLAGTASPPDPQDTNQANHIVRLVAGVWRMCWVCGWCGGGWAGSPTLAAGGAWLLRRWARSYLGPRDPPPGAALRAAWAAPGAGGRACARLAQGAHALLRALPGDPSVAQRAVALLVTVAAFKHKDEETSACTQVWECVQWGLGPGGAALAPGARRGLARSAALAAARLPPSERAVRLAGVLSPARAALVEPDNSPALLHSLDVYAGLARGVQWSSAECIWEELQAVLEVCSRLAGSASARLGGATAAALRTAAAAAERLPCLLPAEPAERMMLSLALLLQAYATLPPLHSTVKQPTAEDDYVEELSLVMEVVRGAASAHWLQGLYQDCPSTLAARAAGARAVLPRLAPPSPMLDHPTIKHQYYRLLQDLGPTLLCSLEDEYFNLAMVSISEGLEGGPAGSGTGPVCELLNELATRLLQEPEDARLRSALEPLSSRLLSMAVAGALQEELRAASAAFYYLMCAMPHLRSQLPPGLSNQPFDRSRAACLSFREDFEKFIAEMQNSTYIK